MNLPCMTAAEKHEIRRHLDLLLLTLGVVDVQKKTRDAAPSGPNRRDRFYLRLETALSIDLQESWKSSYSEALKVVFRMIPDEITREAMDLLEREISFALGDAFAMSAAVRRQVRTKIEQAYAASKSEWGASKAKTKPWKYLSMPDQRAIDVLTQHNCFWLGEHYGEQIGPKVSTLTQKALDEGLGRAELARQLRRTLAGEAPEDYRYWDVAASAALVRARSFGAVSGMEEAGLTTFEVMAMGDERTCPICREMNGRVFSVAESRKVIDSVLALDDPKEFKEAMPWLSAPPVGVSSARLTQSGRSMPPFHGRCRCIIIESTETVKIAVSSFDTLRSGKVSGFDQDTRIARVSDARNLPAKGLSNWKYDRVGKTGKVLERRFYDDEGEAVLDVHAGDHGKPETHFHGAHAHDWQDSGKPKKPRKLRQWEKDMLDELISSRIKKIEGTPLTYLPDVGESGFYSFVPDFIKDLETGFEITINWRGHEYLVYRYGDEFRIGETYHDDDQIFETPQELLDNAVMVTGEKFGDVVLQVEVDSIS